MKIHDIIKKLAGRHLAEIKLQSLQVRELEEDSKGHFVAFVDEGPHSWDVQIKMDSSTLDILKHQCDCPNKKSFCDHQYSVLYALTASNRVASQSTLVKKIKKRKLTKVEQLLGQFEEQKVMQWLANELESDKELFFRFESALKHNDPINAVTIEKHFKDSLKAVLGNRKTMQLPDVIKVIRILDNYYEKVFLDILPRMHETSALICLPAMLGGLNKMSNRINKNTTRIGTFEKKILEKFHGGISQISPLKLDDFLKNIIRPEIIQSFGVGFILRAILSHKEKINELELIDTIKKLLLSKEGKSQIEYSEFEVIFGEIMKAGLSEHLIGYLPLIYYRNSYNCALLQEMQRIGLHDLVIELCDKLLIGYHQSYKPPYHKILIKSLEVIEDFERIDSLKMELFDENPSIEGFNEIYNKLTNETERKKLIDRVLRFQKDRFMPHYADLLELKFYVLNMAEMHKEMLDIIRDITGCILSMNYADKLLNFHKDLYVKKLLNPFFDVWNVPEGYLNFLHDLLYDNYNIHQLKKISDSIRQHLLKELIITVMKRKLKEGDF